jgi:hypothetical protein
MWNLNEKFSDEEAELLKHSKEKLRSKLGRDRLSWRDYLLQKAMEEQR